MITFLKAIIRSIIEKTQNGRKYLALYRFRHYLEEVGWFKSNEKHVPVDLDGRPLPWYTYTAIKFLEKKIEAKMTVFEYGSGNSSLWWSERVSSVISIEHDLSWFDYMKNRIIPNIEYIYCEQIDGGRYNKIISEYEKKFDIVVIDGRDRINCAKNALGALKDNGIILWDNSDRDAYSEGYQYLLENGFKRLDLYGCGPIGNYGWCTTIFYRNDNCLGI